MCENPFALRTIIYGHLNSEPILSCRVEKWILLSGCKVERLLQEEGGQSYSSAGEGRGVLLNVSADASAHRSTPVLLLLTLPLTVHPLPVSFVPVTSAGNRQSPIFNLAFHDSKHPHISAIALPRCDLCVPLSLTLSTNFMNKTKKQNYRTC